MKRYSTIIIGGGASGIMAAISAGRKGDPVLILERMPRLGKKILASGNGRCNLVNDNLNESYYNSPARSIIKSVFSQFGKESMLNFFKTLGLETYSDGGRIFPVTNQSASVLKVMELELKRLGIMIELDCEISGISHTGNGFKLTSKSGQIIESEKIVLACGGRSYPALGSDGNGYKLAAHLGHSIVEPVPSAVPLIVKDRLCHLLQGQKIFANAKSIIDGKIIAEASGEVLFTKYGLSGTAILDVSESIPIALNRLHKKDVAVSIDMAPFMKREALKDKLTDRLRNNFSCEEIIAGILPNKFGVAFSDLSRDTDAGSLAGSLKDKRFMVSGTRGWNEAEFTSGGINISEVDPGTLESKPRKGLYLAGEILDVDGKRGGYNLAWAWGSGFIAGLTG